MAARGLNVVLLARRREVLDELAGSITASTGRDARVLAVDLTTYGAADRVVAGTAGLDVGLMA